MKPKRPSGTDPRRTGERPRGPRLIHHAMLSMMVAAGLSYSALAEGGPAWLYAISVPFWIAGIYFIVRGRRELLNERRRREGG